MVGGNRRQDDGRIDVEEGDRYCSEKHSLSSILDGFLSSDEPNFMSIFGSDTLGLNRWISRFLVRWSIDIHESYIRNMKASRKS